MLAEIFLLKLQHKLRTTAPARPAARDPRFVPITQQH